MDDPHNLRRFLDAQETVWPDVIDELGRGAKTSHWMWFVFPQLKGLGRSSTATFYGIGSRDEALAYWRQPVLGPRLRQVTALMLAVKNKSALQILETPDDMKFRSSMTLFEQVAPEEPVFGQALDRYFGGERDRHTLDLLESGAS